MQMITKPGDKDRAVVPGKEKNGSGAENPNYDIGRDERDGSVATSACTLRLRRQSFCLMVSEDTHGLVSMLRRTHVT